MLHLVYTLQLTEHARTHNKEFWEWLHSRQSWFYDGLDMIQAPRWFMHVIGQNVHCLEHSVAFDDEAAWGAYRKAISQRSKDPEWEKRRIEQEKWWEIIDSRLMNDIQVESS
ncbi:hypothetical protein ACGTN6_16210 [Halomonas sp. THAF12]|uniref:hypothetical protein n=1 Tax=Halomonas sp. B23F22_10 TaxID=3459515 RepID=UPI00373E8ECF